MRSKDFIVLTGLALSACGQNVTPTYGDSGLPKNCRAIIKANIDGWRSGANTADGALASIDRNCGENGYSWGR
jgi:hypothetical protein